jgi:hypothetical protein
MYDAVIGRFPTVDPMAEKYLAFSPFVYVGNNPLNIIDPDGRQWKDPKNDEKIAKNLQEGIKNRLETENKNLADANKRIAELKKSIAEKTSKKLERKLASAEADAKNSQASIDNLKASSAELTTMGDKNVKQEFTFKQVNGSEGDTYLDNGVITMEITSDANAIHEAAHGYQMYEGKITGGPKGQNIYTENQLFENEISAYQRQYAFDESSLTKRVTDAQGFSQTITLSYMGAPQSANDINRAWLMGVRDANRNYLYGRIVFPKLDNSAMEKILDGIKKNSN